jgi:hypothetical protein
MARKENVTRSHPSPSTKESDLHRITKKQRTILKEIALGDIEL